MHFEPHAMLGWAIGNLGGADRRLRNYCTLGAVLPDIDAAPYLFSAQAYAEWHHTFGHNVFLMGAFTAWVGWRCRSGRAVLLSFLSFSSHLLTDALLSGWVLYLFWPFSRKGYLLPGAVGLEAPINTWLVYVSLAAIPMLALICQRTPVDIFSPRLDRLLIGLFRRKRLSCGTCQRPASQTCDTCGQPVCNRHGRVRRGFQLICPRCGEAGAT